ncbi:YbhN family protein [Modestobacter sp. NPDC049651]|uniref:lysylphosphatidylglycerol synthase transmembrane domain-containing protein n=1 Tax=unclassified Modestobacter TaxID=2643866 RepID=UPI0033EA8B80
MTTSPAARRVHRPGRPAAWLTALLVVAAAATAWSQRADLRAAGRAVRTGSPAWLAVLGGGLLVWWAAWALVHGTALRSAGAALTRRDVPELCRASVAAVALNAVVKSGGTAGLAALTRAGRRTGWPRRTVQQGYLLSVAAADAGFLVAVGLGLLVLLLHGPFTAVDAVAAGAVAVLTAGRLALLVLALRRPALVQRLGAAGARVRDRLLRRPHRPLDPRAVADFTDGVRRLAARPAAAVPPVLAAATVDGAAVLMLWAAVAAAGGGDHPAAALAGYLLGAMAAVLGPLPGGLGVTEAGTLATLVGSGVPTGAAVAGTLLFRLAEFWLPLVVGGLVWWVGRQPPARREGAT